MISRIPIMAVSPVVEGGTYPAKATVGEPFDVEATVFREGHDQLGAGVVLTGPEGAARPLLRLRETIEPDIYTAPVTPDAEGPWTFRIESWSDPHATWRHDAPIKVAAGVDVALMLTEGTLLCERALAELPTTATADRALITDLAAALQDDRLPVEVRMAAATAPEVDDLFDRAPLRDLVSTSPEYPFFADRVRALYGSWYEFFPRSEGAFVDDDGVVVSGTFATAQKRLDAVAAMGFDVIYLPPIHPIGEVNRKGRNNTLDPAPEDTGSPWAIGSPEGGHDAIHPALGGFDDFDAFVARANELDLEVALDLALQCAPDHPWVSKHPEWFTTRADGSIAYAENPPKKYQDIYPINFDNDYAGLYAEVLRIVRLWMSHGVRIFRVDNPHTKPVVFWDELLGEIRRTDPDVLFLAEAFTRPAMMHGLATVGFHQSYSYFTWRNAKWELEAYFNELSHESSAVMRPNLFVNTPDILPTYLQYGGPAAFKIRATLAAMAGPTYGVYAGFELYEHVALRAGGEEYLDSEKYQIRIRDWAKAEADGSSLAPYLTRLNAIRVRHRALQLLRNVYVHRTDSDQVLCFSKRYVDAAGHDDTVIVVVNLDPHAARATTVHLNMPALGMDWQDSFVARDEISGEDFPWLEHNYVRLDPNREPAHVISVMRGTA